ncbi:carbamoyltransferase [Candidatus Woesearchaeota archaeon]|jgi:carbamoyltransferase|nr:carbamoyltransferase [Candidatus Woesearchaeota archaeon]MBT4114128.1 carbamoyltransferase [Candidatus Woesearchaeota archaeon]MBT4248429.1 carbamoyltransferase [Candidatus Woesearchaeota archaeon]
MYILGISCYYHDASAALLKDGVIVAAAEEERFTRKKHDISFPTNAINYCLKEVGISADKLDYVTFYEKPFLKFERILYQHITMFPRSFWSFYKTVPSWVNERLRIRRMLKKTLKYDGKVFFVEHHQAHAASSYLISPFDKAALLTVDGVGEWATTTFGYAKGTDLKIMKEINFPHSLGLLYSAVTAYLGFKVNNSEYKVMGLSPYGNRTKSNPYYAKMRKLIDIKPDGSYALDMSYFVYHYKMSMPSSKFVKVFGPTRKWSDPLTKRHKDISAALQMVTEEAIFAMLNSLYKETKCTNLCIAGGCALNSVANGKLLRNTPFKKIYIQPSAGDGGTSMGAALYTYNVILGKKKRYVLTDAFFGPQFTDRQIKKFLDRNKIKYTQFKSDKELVKTVASLIKTENVIGWFQGRMEWGPRALGARSILSDPTNPKMQDILNLKVKHREKFRPFAPVICADDAKTYFECDEPVPVPTDFMLMVYPIKKFARSKVPSITHVDGSGRLQTIRRKDNQLYYDLIKEFGKISKIPILINTSFNIRGEPIVCTPFHAYRCMMGTGIDYLVMNRFFIGRADNPQHMWDSESHAKD